MSMEPHIGIEMLLPEGKQPGFYAQLVKRLADTGAVADRDKTLLLVPAERTSDVRRVLDHYRVASEDSRWLLLGSREDGWRTAGIWSDYGIETRTGRLYLDLSLATIVSLAPLGGDTEPQQAALQLEEHAAAWRTAADDAAGGAALFALDRQLLPLAEGIAAAYRCTAAERQFGR